MQPRSDPEPVPASVSESARCGYVMPTLSVAYPPIDRPHDMRLVDLEMIHHGDHVVAELLVAVGTPDRAARRRDV